jgi:hypothetical protein
MNERIQELEKQSYTEAIHKITVQALENSLFEPIEPTVTVGEGENKVTIPLVFAEKFAELIIQECCSAIRLNDVFFGGKFQGAILKHFGVEE